MFYHAISEKQISLLGLIKIHYMKQQFVNSTVLQNSEMRRKDVGLLDGMCWGREGMESR